MLTLTLPLRNLQYSYSQLIVQQYISSFEIGLKIDVLEEIDIE